MPLGLRSIIFQEEDHEENVGLWHVLAHVMYGDLSQQEEANKDNVGL